MNTIYSPGVGETLCELPESRIAVGSHVRTIASFDPVVKFRTGMRGRTP